MNNLKIGWGIAAGLIAGIVFGLLMQIMFVTLASGERVPMMVMVARTVGSNSVFTGWIYHLIYSGVLGGLFGFLIGRRATGYFQGGSWGLFYGSYWWVVGGLILMPMLLGMPVFSAFTLPGVATMAAISCIGHLIWGLVLGVVYVTFRHHHDSPRFHGIDPAAAH